MAELNRRFKFIAEVPEGTQVCVYNGMVIVARPGMPPAVVTEHGLEDIRAIDADDVGDVGVSLTGAFNITPKH